MRKRIKVTVLLLSAVVLSITGCTRADDENVCVPCGGTQVEFVISDSDFTETESRAVNENKLSNITLWLFEGSELRYTFTPTGRQLIRNVTPGTYTLYASGNTTLSLPQDFTVNDLETVLFKFDPAAFNAGTSIPMSRKMTVEVTAGEFNRIEVEMERIVSKIDLNISVADDLNINILSVQLCSQAREIGLFGPATPDSYFDGERVELANHTRQYETRLYLPENCRGTNDAITQQSEKGADNAPPGATYLLITALSGVDKIIDYHVFLGENNTTDFNVRRNTHYTVDIHILGENITDTRITDFVMNYTYSIYSPWVEYGLGSSPITLITSYRSETDYGMRLRVDFICGSPDAINVDGEPATYIEVDLAPTSSKSWSVVYNPVKFNGSNCNLNIMLTYTDKYGRVFKRSILRKYANYILLRIPSFRNIEGYLYPRLVLSVTGAVYSSNGWPGFNRFISGYIAFTGNTIKLSVADYEGSEFDEWWTASNHNKIEYVSDQPSITYNPPTNYTEITPFVTVLPVTVTYDPNGGTGGRVFNDYYWHEHVTKTLWQAAVSAPSGFNFAGWSRTPDGSSGVIAAGGTVVLNGNVTLYAQWERDLPYTITFNKLLTIDYLRSGRVAQNKFTIDPWPLAGYVFSLRAEVVTGEGNYVELTQKGTNLKNGDIAVSGIVGGVFDTWVRYSAPLFGSSNEKLSIRYTLTDGQNNEWVFTDDWIGRNVLDIMARWNNVNVACGSSATGAVTSETTVSTDQRTKYRTYYMDESGIRLTALPDAGYAFAGWYLDGDYTQLYSTERIIDYVPQHSVLALYPKVIVTP